MKKNNKIDAIIFDFMGVLLFQKANYISNSLVDEIDKMIARVVDDEKFKKKPIEKFKLSKSDFDGILDEIVGKYEKYSSLWDLLPMLKKRYKLAIINNGTALTLPLFEAKHKISANFDLFISSAKEGIKKPDKEIFLLTAERLGVEPSRCLFMDDLEENIKGAESVGMKTIWWRSKEEGLKNFKRFISYEKEDFKA